MTSHLTTERTASNGTARTAPYATEYGMPASRRSLSAQVIATLGMLAGVWVAVSPWFLVMQTPVAREATASDLIAGLAVAALGLFAIGGARGFAGLQVGSLLLGVWLIISPFILAAKFAITSAMYWSNIWSGAIIAILAAAALAGLRRPGAAA